MTSFAEQLSAARKAAGLTQEELASAIFVTRSTISSWERGRTVPGMDSLRLLSEALHVNFTADPMQAADSAPSADVTEGQTQLSDIPAAVRTRPSSMSGKQWMAGLLCASVAVLAICFALFGLPALRQARSKTPVPNVDAAQLVLEEPKLYTREWFQGENARFEGEPYVEVSTPITVNTTDQPFPLWVYSVIIEEVAGRSFTPEQIDMYHYHTNVGYEHNWIKADALWAAPSGNAWRMEGLEPVSDAKGIGYIVYGHDEWGRRMSFRAYLDFTKVNE